MALATDEERHALIQQNPAYANIICRCEMVSEGEILDAIHRPLGATTTDGVKRRTRAGMGRCQSGFCLPAVCEILAKEWGVPLTAVTKKGGGSYILTGRTKGTETNEAARIRVGAAAGTEPPQHVCADEAAFMSRAKNENGGAGK